MVTTLQQYPNTVTNNSVIHNLDSVPHSIVVGDAVLIQAPDSHRDPRGAPTQRYLPYCGLCKASGMDQHRATLEKNRSEVSKMFDGVARRYDVMNTILTVGLDSTWRDAVVEAVDPRPGEIILDLAAGTGTSSAPFQRAGAKVYPSDMSLGMLNVGKERQPHLSFVAADALRLPYADDVFDAVTISFGLRNVEDTLLGLQEMRRVTKPGGRLVVCEFSHPTSKTLRDYYRKYLTLVMPALAKVSTNPVAYEYLADSILAWPDQQGLADLMHEAGWRNVEWQNMTGGIVALHRGWVPVQ